MTKKVPLPATKASDENLVMTKKPVSPAASNCIVVEHNGREAVISNSKFVIRYADNCKTVEVESAEVTVK